MIPNTRDITLEHDDIALLTRSLYGHEGVDGVETYVAAALAKRGITQLRAGMRVKMPARVETLVGSVSAADLERARHVFPEVFESGRTDAGRSQLRRTHHREQRALSAESVGGAFAPGKAQRQTPVTQAKRHLGQRLRHVVQAHPEQIHSTVGLHLTVMGAGKGLPPRVRDDLIEGMGSLAELGDLIERELRAAGVEDPSRAAVDKLVDRLKETYFEDKVARPVANRLKQLLRVGTSHLNVLAEDYSVAATQVGLLRALEGDELRTRLRALGLDDDDLVRALAGGGEDAVGALQEVARDRAAKADDLIRRLPNQRIQMFELLPRVTRQITGSATWPPELPPGARREAIEWGADAYDNTEEKVFVIAGAAVAAAVSGGILAPIGVGAAFGSGAGIGLLSDLPGLADSVAAAGRTEALEVAGQVQPGTHEAEMMTAIGLWIASGAVSGVVGGVAGASAKANPMGTVAAVSAGGHAVRSVGKPVARRGAIELLKRVLVSANTGAAIARGWAQSAAAAGVAGMLDEGESDAAYAELQLELALGERALRDSGVDLETAFVREFGRRDSEAFQRARLAFAVVAGAKIPALVNRAPGVLEAAFAEFLRQTMRR